MKKEADPPGFAALISAIVIGAALMAAAAGAGAASFYARAAGLEGDYKTHSEALARSCADYAALRAATDPAYAGGNILSVGSGRCAVGALSRAGADVRFQVQGVYEQSYTDLQVVADVKSGAVISLQEVPKF